MAEVSRVPAYIYTAIREISRIQTVVDIVGRTVGGLSECHDLIYSFQSPFRVL